MGRPRKSIEELKISGTFAHNRKRYEGAPVPSAPSADEPLGRPPRYFTKEQKAAWKEITDTCPGLTVADRLLVEVASQMLAKQRAGQAKASESNRLMVTLEKLRSRSASAAAIAQYADMPSTVSVNPAPENESEMIVTGGDYYDREAMRKQMIADGRMSREQYYNEQNLELDELDE